MTPGLFMSLKCIIIISSITQCNDFAVCYYVTKKIPEEQVAYRQCTSRSPLPRRRGSARLPTMLIIIISLLVTQSLLLRQSVRFSGAWVGLMETTPLWLRARAICLSFLTGRLSPCAQPLELPVGHDTYHSFRTFCFLSTERINESYIKAPTATSNCWLTMRGRFWEIKLTCRLPTRSKFT